MNSPARRKFRRPGMPRPRRTRWTSPRQAELPRELFLVEPPGHVHVHPGGAVGVVWGIVLQRGDPALQPRPDGVHQVLADQTAAVGEAVRACCSSS